MARVDYERAAVAYDAGRSLPLDALEAWRAALARYLPLRTRLPVLDLGSGTGIFSRALAEWFDADVVGVEPAARMRDQARQRPRARVTYVGGDAEHVPLKDGSCGAAWLSTVIHHIPDLTGCARELRRVLRSGGRVLVRSAFPERHDHITLFRFFPGAGAIAAQFPSVEATVAAFASAGFEPAALESVPQQSAPSLRVFCDRVPLMRHADSTLASLSDAEFARGMEALERAAAREETPAPVIDQLDLLVLG